MIIPTLALKPVGSGPIVSAGLFVCIGSFTDQVDGSQRFLQPAIPPPIPFAVKIHCGCAALCNPRSPPLTRKDEPRRVYFYVNHLITKCEKCTFFLSDENQTDVIVLSAPHENSLCCTVRHLALNPVGRPLCDKVKPMRSSGSKRRPHRGMTKLPWIAATIRD